MVMGECIGASKCWSLLRGGLSQEGSLSRGTTVLKVLLVASSWRICGTTTYTTIVYIMCVPQSAKFPRRTIFADWRLQIFRENNFPGPRI